MNRGGKKTREREERRDSGKLENAANGQEIREGGGSFKNRTRVERKKGREGRKMGSK